MSPFDLSTSVTANVRSFEKISLKSVTTDESSTDPEPSAAVSPPPAPLAKTPPEAAPRTSLLSDSRQSSLNRPGSAKSLSVSGEEVSHVTGATSPSSPSKHWGSERTVEMDTAIPVPEPGQYRDTTAGSGSVTRNTETSTTTQQQQQLHGDDQGRIGQNLGLTEDVALKLIMQALENHPNTASFQSGMAALSEISHKLKDKPHICENIMMIPNIRKYLPQSLMDLLDTVSTGAAPAHSPAQSIPSTSATTSSGDTLLAIVVFRHKMFIQCFVSIMLSTYVHVYSFPCTISILPDSYQSTLLYTKECHEMNKSLETFKLDIYTTPLCVSM